MDTTGWKTVGFLRDVQSSKGVANPFHFLAGEFYSMPEHALERLRKETKGTVFNLTLHPMYQWFPHVHLGHGMLTTTPCPTCNNKTSFSSLPSSCAECGGWGKLLVCVLDYNEAVKAQLIKKQVLALLSKPKQESANVVHP